MKQESRRRTKTLVPLIQRIHYYQENYGIMDTPAYRCSLVDLTVSMQRSRKVPSINIYVGNLSFDTSEDQLKELFESYGQVESATIISDKFPDVQGLWIR